MLNARGGKSQEFIAAAGGPSTTTQSKIELGKALRISRKTKEALEYVYGWEAGSVQAILDGGDATEADVPDLPPFTKRPDEPDDSEYMTMRTRQDPGHNKYVEVVSVKDHQGTPTRVELRYWPGSDERSVPMSDLGVIVGRAHRGALGITLNADELQARRDQRAREREASEVDDNLDVASLETDKRIDQSPGESSEDAP